MQFSPQHPPELCHGAAAWAEPVPAERYVPFGSRASAHANKPYAVPQPVGHWEHLTGRVSQAGKRRATTLSRRGDVLQKAPAQLPSQAYNRLTSYYSTLANACPLGPQAIDL